jgi:predicted nuclease of predicted toxin-antitoxin system
VIKFIVDAQLPYRLALLLKQKGFDALHTDDLPNKERTTDTEIRTLAKIENRIVITKDNDFFESYIINKSPAALLLISTGNIINKELFILFDKYLDQIIEHFETYNFVELTNNELFAHQ